MILTLLGAVLARAVPGHAGQAIQQQLECYDGAGLSTVFPDAITDLGKYGWEDRITSCCVTGTWILYAGTEYNSQEQDQGQPVYWTYGDHTCLSSSRTRHPASGMQVPGQTGASPASTSTVGHTSLGRLIGFSRTPPVLV